MIVPVFNAGAYLRQAVDSALMQTERSFELIIVDDGSTDGAVDRLIVDDPRVRIIRQANQGAALACNTGLAVARGDLIAILDQDDLWLPAKLERHRACSERHPDVAFSFSWSHYIDPAGEPMPLPARRFKGRTSFDLLYRDFVIGNTSSIVFRRRAMQSAAGFDPASGGLYDLDLILQISLQGADNGIAIEEDLCAYRRHPRQMSRRWVTLRRDWEVLTRKFGRLASVSISARREADSNMLRYFAFLAQEADCHAVSFRLFGESLLAGRIKALGDARNWKMLVLVTASALLPRSVFNRLLSHGTQIK